MTAYMHATSKFSFLIMPGHLDDLIHGLDAPMLIKTDPRLSKQLSLGEKGLMTPLCVILVGYQICPAYPGACTISYLLP